MTELEFINEIESLLDIEQGILKKDTALTEIQVWDSMAKLTFIAMVEEKFGQVIDSKDLAKVKSVGDLLNLVGSRLKD